MHAAALCSAELGVKYVFDNYAKIQESEKFS